MLFLVLADRDVSRLVAENVGRHQHRIGIQAEPGQVAVLARLLLELRHPVEPAERGQTAENPAEFGMRPDHALVEDDAVLGVDAGGDIRGGDLARRMAQLRRVLRLGQRVQIDDAEDALVIVLQRDPVADRAEIIAEMKIAGRLNAGKNAVHRTSISKVASALADNTRRTWKTESLKDGAP